MCQVQLWLINNCKYHCNVHRMQMSCINKCKCHGNMHHMQMSCINKCIDNKDMSCERMKLTNLPATYFETIPSHVLREIVLRWNFQQNSLLHENMHTHIQIYVHTYCNYMYISTVNVHIITYIHVHYINSHTHKSMYIFITYIACIVCLHTYIQTNNKSAVTVAYISRHDFWSRQNCVSKHYS